MKFLDSEIAPLGMGCWPIGGAMFGSKAFGAPGTLGYAGANDAESIRTIHAAYANGIRLFDTAAVYGAGHAERLLAQALRDRPDALVVTKIGIAMDEGTKMLTGFETDPASALPAIERCLARLRRESVDIVLLHLNDLPVAQAEPIFDAMERARQAGKVRAYGWSTDLAASAQAMAGRPGFEVVEHATNVLLDAPVMRSVVEKRGLTALVRSPLGMGLLGGRYDQGSVMPPADIRSTPNLATGYFEHGRPNPAYLESLAAIRELLQTGGRTMAQGALAWLWAKSDRNLPVPGARTVEQIEGLAAALSFGPLPADLVAQIDAVSGADRDVAEDRPR